MKFTKYLYLVAVLMAFTACKNETSKTPEIIEVETGKVKDLDVSERSEVTFKDENVAAAFKMYNKVRAALVNTNSSEASSNAKDLFKSAAMQNTTDDTKKALQLLMDGKDIKEQRKHFVTVTAAIEKLVAEAVESGTVYKQYCPMAFGNTGAYWLSDSKEIRNPYFGDKMLKCGRVDSEIK